MFLTRISNIITSVEYFSQVDHFSFGNSSKFSQRYLVNDTYWEAAKDERDGGPIFFYTGEIHCKFPV